MKKLMVTTVCLVSLSTLFSCTKNDGLFSSGPGNQGTSTIWKVQPAPQSKDSINNAQQVSNIPKVQNEAK